ncbi:MAG TPA: hypothetical protein VK667_08405, partial [Ktedonobacteraceae bacterium]|nr:hypothetical protein [Ktedonobacteraceae bacterium]
MTSCFLSHLTTAALLWTLTKYSGNPAGADQSAMGAMNRPLQRRRRFWYIQVHLLHPFNGRYLDELIHLSKEVLWFSRTRTIAHSLPG